MRWLLVIALGCGGPRPEPAIESRVPSAPPDASATPSGRDACYPYALHDGKCLTRCNFYAAGADQGCATGSWPLICNKDGSCTPENVME